MELSSAQETGVRQCQKRATILFTLAIAIAILSACQGSAWAADPPCNVYPPAQQPRCTKIWSALNQEDGPSIAQFGLDQQKRRDAGTITAEQHLAENMRFIKQSTERRLERLQQRMKE